MYLKEKTSKENTWTYKDQTSCLDREDKNVTQMECFQNLSKETS